MAYECKPKALVIPIAAIAALHTMKYKLNHPCIHLYNILAGLTPVRLYVNVPESVSWHSAPAHLAVEGRGYCQILPASPSTTIPASRYNHQRPPAREWYDPNSRLCKATNYSRLSKPRRYASAPNQQVAIPLSMACIN
jgi:hypothetical protein